MEAERSVVACALPLTEVKSSTRLIVWNGADSKALIAAIKEDNRHE